MKLAKTFRLRPDIVARLERYARRQRRSLTAVVEAALDTYLAVAEEGRNGRPADPPAPAEVDLARYLSERTGIPRALCVSYRESGRVTVDGVTHRGHAVAPDALKQVRLDGELV